MNKVLFAFINWHRVHFGSSSLSLFSFPRRRCCCWSHNIITELRGIDRNWIHSGSWRRNGRKDNENTMEMLPGKVMLITQPKRQMEQGKSFCPMTPKTLSRSFIPSSFLVMEFQNLEAQTRQVDRMCHSWRDTQNVGCRKTLLSVLEIYIKFRLSLS